MTGADRLKVGSSIDEEKRQKEIKIEKNKIYNDLMQPENIQEYLGSYFQYESRGELLKEQK